MSIPATSSTKGRIRNIMEAFYEWLITALDDAGHTNFYVGMDYKIDIMNLPHNPLVTIRITPTTLADNSYGRIWQGDTASTAMQATYMFSLHVFSRYNVGINEDHNRDAWITARVIADYLNSISRTTLDAKGIWAIDDIRFRESDPMGRNVGRIIIDGMISVTREDSP